MFRMDTVNTKLGLFVNNCHLFPAVEAIARILLSEERRKFFRVFASVLRKMYKISKLCFLEFIVSKIQP